MGVRFTKLQDGSIGVCSVNEKHGRNEVSQPHFYLVRDAVFPETMWRVRFPSGELSDMTNLVRAQDLAILVLKRLLRRAA